MTPSPDQAERFLALHQPGHPLVMPNAWDQGSARLLVSLGAAAVATSSSAFAATLGRLDGQVTRDEALAHAAAVVDTVDVPVSADLERGFGHQPPAVAETFRLALDTGLAGGSIEDFTGDGIEPIYDLDLAAARVAAAAEAVHVGVGCRFVLTARCENALHGRLDLDDTIARLRAYAEAGADVLFAPGWTALADLRRIVASVDKPVNALLQPGSPAVPELAAVGVSRVSTGGALGFLALGAAASAARELLEHGTVTFLDQARASARQVLAALA